jgi:hypothetical protein
MKVTDCLDVGLAISAPFEHHEPDEQWKRAIAAEVLPPAVIDLYEGTKYLSASRLAGFSTESQRIVSVYLGRVLRSMVECFVEAAELVPAFREHLADGYTPLKKRRGQSWDQTALQKARSVFRLVLIDLFGILDTLAELVAIFLPGEVKTLKVGKGMIRPLYDWAVADLPQPGLIVSPARPYVEDLHGRLRRLLVSDSTGRAWFALIRMYRNKVTHLGHQTWQEVGLQGPDGEIHYFVPRSWPFIMERHLGTTGDDNALANYLKASLVYIETHELLQQSISQARLVADNVVTVLFAAYRALGIRRVEDIAAQLEATSESSEFTGEELAG